MPNVLNKLASTNNVGYNPKSSELNTLFVYYTTLVEINPSLVKQILNGYAINNC